MDAFGIAAILGRRQRLEQMLQAGAQRRCKCVVERDLCIEAKLSRLSRERRRVVGKVKAPRRLAADRWLYRPVFGEPQCEFVDGARAAALQLQFDLADG